MIIKHGRRIFLRSPRGVQRYVGLFALLCFSDADWLGEQAPITGIPRDKLDFFPCMEIFWKYRRKRLENPISIVLSNSTSSMEMLSVVWKYSRNTLEMKLPFCRRGPVFPVYGITLLKIVFQVTRHGISVLIAKKMSLKGEF